MKSLREFHEKHENWWMIVLAIIALLGLLYFAGVLGGFGVVR